MMKSLFFIAALTTSSLTAATAFSSAQASGSKQAPGQGQGQGQGAVLDNADRKFLNEAAASGLAEVKLGQLATKQAANEDVKKFGQRMIDDHSRMNSDLTKLAQPKGVTPPQTLDKKYQEKIDKLSKRGGAEFDKAYMDEMVDEHQHDVDSFEKAARDAKDADVKGFAARTLPMLREHLTSAKDIQSRIKGQQK